MAKHDFQTVVVGGGLIGKSTALALAQAGFRVALLARECAAPAGRFDTRVYALSASSRELLAQLRVWQALDPARLSPVHDMRVFGDARGALHFSAYQAAVPELAWIVEASLIERALDAALRFQPGVTWFGQRARQLRLNDVYSDGVALLTLDDGATLRADVVVGADGAHSWVRAQIGARVSGRDYRQIGVVANFKLGKAHGETAYQWFGEGEIVAMLPLPGPYASLVWSAETSHAKRLLALDGAQLAAAVEGATHGVLGALECVTPAAGFPLGLQRVDRLTGPRVALVGDAAHLIHPLAGQGMNLGLRDVATLRDVLSGRETFRALGDDVALRRYERARREDIEALMLATDGLYRLFSMRHGVARVVRNAGMALLGTQPLIKRWLIGAALG